MWYRACVCRVWGAEAHPGGALRYFLFGIVFGKIAPMKILKILFATFGVSLTCLAAEAAGAALGVEGAKIAARVPPVRQDRMQGFLRTRFAMDGCEAWVVEPKK